MRRLATRVGVAALLVSLAAACSSGGSSPPLTISSTLAGHASLPHRIQWQAMPSVSGTDVAQVDFLIDGKVFWVEHHAPYFYGSDGNFLVTSFLTPGRHVFMVKVITTAGRTASQTVTATVAAAPEPPPALAGTWWSYQTQDTAVSGSPPTGFWRLVVSKAGWRIYDTQGSGDMLDIVYPSPDQLVVQTGMATGHPLYGSTDGDQPHFLDLNGWCDNDPGPPVRYSWSVTPAGLSLHYEGGQPCAGFNAFMTSAWSRVR
jgi:hypothetical protein